ncbi:hypothetical protein TH66_00560 [Carbonactinospora thermoautotrophica]|uniref:DUF6292 domain-containing protein n=1 Tax=Carbonactinospora thermoautotrophica TaxID=1469144 RepID=A0A132ND73_9ACTN|nr:hypothetical protein TH66_00560 [Carbonactinospora thermoautotrophica]KWX08053.1 hypothetical protein TR74_16645 [Carbonactinospora thermoautotrophica]
MGDSMTATELPTGHHERADHRPYVDAVCAALEAQEIGVGTRWTSATRLREATVRLAPDPEETAFGEAEEVLLRWTEEAGWFLVAPTVHEGQCLEFPWYMGFGVLPDPDEVAVWVDTLLIRPDLTPSREDGPYRRHTDYDPEFEQALRSYAQNPAAGDD